MTGGPIGSPPAGERGSVPGWLAIVALVFCFPLGFVLVLFTNWSTRAKVIVDGLIVLAVVAFGIHNTLLLQAGR